MVGATALGIGSGFIASLLGLGWVSAAVVVALIFAYLLAYIALTRDAFIGRLLLFGVVAGFLELLADWWLVDATRTLVYSPGPLILRSPLYMPFAWAGVIVPLAYWGHWGAQRARLSTVVIGIAILGAVYIPMYEQFAFGAGWWQYERTPMLSHAPAYIILAELFIAAPLPWIALQLARRAWPQAILFGLGQGLWICAACAAAYLLLG